MQEKDAALLRPIVEGTWGGGESSLVESAYLFFRERLGSRSKEEILALLSVVLVKLSAVWVTLQDGDNAHRVFQTLNAGGKKLKQSDLVRNYFFLLLGELGNEFYASHWRLLERDHTDRELEEYLVAWTISQGHSGGKDSLFNYFHKDLLPNEGSPSEILRYGEDLVSTVRLFDWIRRPDDSSLNEACKRSLSDLRNWGPLPAEGLILWLLRGYAANWLSMSDLHEALEIILSFVARRQLAGFEPNLHKSIFVAVTRKLHSGRSDESNGTSIVEHLHYLLSIGEEVRTWPSDELVKARVRSTPVYTESRAAWVFVLLDRINRQLFDNVKHAPPPLNRAKYSVEHVLPQNLSERWVEDLREWGVDNPLQLHQGLLHVLGNLTLTPINSELSNLPFAVKREKLQDDWLRLNSDISAGSTWTRHRIDERSSSLAQKACASFVPPLNGAELLAASAKFGASREQAADLSLQVDTDDVEI